MQARANLKTESVNPGMSYSKTRLLPLDPAPRTYAPGVDLIARDRFELDRTETLGADDVENWLLGAASKTTTALELVTGFASQLALSGLGVDRMTVGVGTLHPQVHGYSWAWSTHDSICDEIQISEETLNSDAFKKNPIYRVVEHGETIRIKLHEAGPESGGGLLKELVTDGFREYVALPLSSRGKQHNAVTLATRLEGGFDPEQWTTLQRLLSIFALHVERHIVERIAQNISLTYLGREAGEQVVNGTIRRGAGLPIEAIVWCSDMRDFSSLSETSESKVVAEMLNSYFSVLADSVIRHGGDVLKFIGDGMLGVFPFSDFETPSRAANAAANAAMDATDELSALNCQNSDVPGWQPLRTGIGLHVGEVFFGNIGATRRLDFTVIGEAVNIASRIEGLCKPLRREIIISKQVADLLDQNAEELGTHALKGMDKPEQLFGLKANR